MGEPESSPQGRPRTGFHEALVVDGLYEMVVTVSTVRLGALTCWGNWWRFEPVPEGAFALLRRITGEQPAPLQAAITGADGLLYEVAPEKVSRSSDVVLRLPAPARYLLWWTLDAALYADALADPALLETEGTTLVVQQQIPAHAGPLWDELAEIEIDRSLRQDICHHLLHRHAFHESRSSPIFDVTPESVRALFTVEFIQLYVKKAQEASANNLATFQHAAAMIEAAEKGLKDSYLERRAAQLFPSAEERKVFDCFRDYAWRCAATGIDGVQFGRSIAMHGPSELPQGGVPDGDAADAGVLESSDDSAWLRAAAKIRQQSTGKKHGPAVHPHLQGVTGPVRVLAPDGVTLSPEQQRLLLEYFESYRFGATLRSTWVDGDEGFDGPTHYRGRMAARTEDWAKQQEQVRERARALLEAQASPHGFLTAVACCYPQDDELLDRYVEAAAYCGLDWWRLLGEAEAPSAPELDPEGRFVAKEWPFWKTFKVRLKPLAETAKASGKISRLLRERLAAYNLARKEATQLLDTLGRLEITLAGGDVDATRHVIRSERALVSIDPTGDTGQVRIRFSSARLPSEPASVVLRFVRETSENRPSGAPSAPSGSAAKTQFESWSPSGQRYVLVAASSDDIRAVDDDSKLFGALAESINLAIAVATVSGEAKAKDRALATFDLTKSVVAVAESLPGALLAMGPELESSKWLKRVDSQVKNLKGLSTWLSRVDGALKIYKGFDTLFSAESDLQYELRHGRSFQADVQYFNGIANIVAGVASVVEIGAAAAAAAGATQVLGLSTALLAGFSATPWGLLLTVGGSILVAGSALVLDLAQPWSEKLGALERALDQACREEVRGARFKMSLQLDALLNALP